MRLKWDEIGKREYEAGADHGAVYYPDGTVEPWNGLIGVTQGHTGGERTPIFANNGKYLNLMSPVDTNLTIEAYSAPPSFGSCVGEAEIIPGVIIGQQNHKHFGFAFRTIMGNDTDGQSHGNRIYIYWDCLATKNDRDFKSITDTVEPETVSYEVSTTTFKLDEFAPTAGLVIDSTVMADHGVMNLYRDLEAYIYGSSNNDPKLPSINVIRELYALAEYLCDSTGDKILDSNGNPVLTNAKY